MSFNPSAGMTPIDVNIPAGACTVSVTSALGSGYRASETDRPKIGEALRSSFSPCLQKSPNAKGTTHLSGQVDASGRVSSVLPSPGGAMPSELAKCLTDAMGRTTLPPPLDGASPLLVFVVNNCP